MRKTNENFDSCNSCKQLVSSRYMSSMSHNFRLFFASNLSVLNFQIFLLMYPGVSDVRTVSITALLSGEAGAVAASCLASPCRPAASANGSRRADTGHASRRRADEPETPLPVRQVRSRRGDLQRTQRRRLT